MRKKTKRISIRLRPEEHIALDHITRATGLTISCALRSIITTVGEMVRSGELRDLEEGSIYRMFASLEGGDTLPYDSPIPKTNHNGHGKA